MLEKMQELIADQLSVDADSITEASSFKSSLKEDASVMLSASQKHLLSKMIWEQILLISMN